MRLLIVIMGLAMSGCGSSIPDNFYVLCNAQEKSENNKGQAFEEEKKHLWNYNGDRISKIATYDFESNLWGACERCSHSETAKTLNFESKGDGYSGPYEYSSEINLETLIYQARSYSENESMGLWLRGSEQGKCQILDAPPSGIEPYV